MIEILNQEYPGDVAWGRFASVIQSSPRQASAPSLPRLLGCAEETANVIRALFGDHALTWLNSPIPALEGETPAQVLARHQKGDRILRTLLMRMPN